MTEPYKQREFADVERRFNSGADLTRDEIVRLFKTTTLLRDRVDTFRKRINAFFGVIHARTGECKACGAPIFYVAMPSGKENPYTADLISHFADCPGAHRFRR